MLSVDTIIIVTHLVRIVGKQNPLFLIYAIAAKVLPAEYLSTHMSRSVVTLLIALAVTGAKKFGLMANMHIFWLWAILTIATPWFRGEGKVTTAFWMLAAIFALQVLTRLIQSLSDRQHVREILTAIDAISPRLAPKRIILNAEGTRLLEWMFPLFFAGLLMLGGEDIGAGVFLVLSGIAIFGILAALRYDGHMVAVGLMPIGWIALSFWGFSWGLGVNTEDYEAIALACEVVLAHFVTAHNLDISIKLTYS